MDIVQLFWGSWERYIFDTRQAILIHFCTTDCNPTPYIMTCPAVTFRLAHVIYSTPPHPFRLKIIILPIPSPLVFPLRKPLSNNPLNHLLQPRKPLPILHHTSKIPLDALLDILCRHVHLDIHRLAHGLRRRHDLFLRISNQHDFPPALLVIDFGNGQTRPIQGDKPFINHISQNVFTFGGKTESDGVAIGDLGEDGGGGVDVALDKVPSHAGVCAHCAL